MRVHLIVRAEFKWIVIIGFAFVGHSSLHGVLNCAPLSLTCVRRKEVRVCTSERGCLVVTAILNERRELIRNEIICVLRRGHISAHLLLVKAN